MADNIVTKQQLIDAGKNADSWEKYWSGNEYEDVITRLNKEYPTHAKALKILMENGGLQPFETQAQLLASVPVVSPTAAKALDTKKVWIWKQTSAEGVEPIVYAWIDTGLSEFEQAKEYTDNEINPLRNILYQNEDHPLEVSVDDNGMMYRITNSKGDLHISGTSLSLKESSLNEDENDVVAILDKNTNVILCIDNSGNLHVPNDIVFNNTSLIQSTSESIYAQSSERIYRKIAGQTLQSALLSRTLKRHEVTPVQTLQDTPGLTNRMPTAIKIPTGLFIIWHHKTKPEYDGDGSGSAFWCGFADIDANQNITIRDKKLFMYPDTDAGILKHPHMGRTSDGRIMLVYEKSIGYVEETPTNKVNYIKYVRYSSNNGVTWTSPKQLTFLNEPAVGSVLIALGTTQNILFLNGRHVVPIYSSTSACAAIYSDNDGQTWAYSKTWTKGVNWGDEPALSLDSDNNIVMAIRPSGDPRCITFCKSTDMGDSWSLMHNDRVISPDNQCNILFDDHINAHILSHSTNAPWQRNKHRLSVSYDDCYNFSLNYAPYPETQYVGYSQLIKWSEGIYLLIHEGNASGYDLNVNEEVSILLITLKEVIENVTYS
jgi:sialidase-1